MSCITNIITIVYQFSMIIIGVCNIIYVVKLNQRKDKGELEAKEADRKISLLKTLVLDHNMNDFYDSFEKIENAARKLLDKEKYDENKKKVEGDFQAAFAYLEQKFLCYFAAIDKNLRNQLKTSCDSCLDCLVKNIGDDGVNLYNQKMYKSKVKDEIEKCRNQILSLLFQYDGKTKVSVPK